MMSAETLGLYGAVDAASSADYARELVQHASTACIVLLMLVWSLQPFAQTADRSPLFDRSACCCRLQWLKNAPLGEFIAHRDIAPFVVPFCEYNHTFNEWCMQQMNGMFYGPSVNVPTADFILIARTWPSTVASRNLEHWAQVIIVYC